MHTLSCLRAPAGAEPVQLPCLRCRRCVQSLARHLHGVSRGQVPVARRRSGARRLLQLLRVALALLSLGVCVCRQLHLPSRLRGRPRQLHRMSGGQGQDQRPYCQQCGLGLHTVCRWGVSCRRWCRLPQVQGEGCWVHDTRGQLHLSGAGGDVRLEVRRRLLQMEHGQLAHLLQTVPRGHFLGAAGLAGQARRAFVGQREGALRPRSVALQAAAQPARVPPCPAPLPSSVL